MQFNADFIAIGFGLMRSRVSNMLLLDKAEANAETDFEIEFCESLRAKLRTYGGGVTLSAAQQHKLQCIAAAGGFWERLQ